MTQGPTGRTRRNPLLLFLAFGLLGLALGLVMFGGSLFDGRAAGPAAEGVLDQVPAFATTTPDVAEILGRGRPEGTLEVGDVAHDFTLLDLDGEPVSLRDFRGSPVIVNFWATWCAPCRIEMPELQAAYEQYQDEGLVILALDQDEPAELARAFFDEMGLTFTALLDEKSVVATTFGSFGVLPTSYFIDRDGVVTAIHRGPMTRGQIDGYLADTLAAAG